MDKILITMGLPASGKTTFAKEYTEKYNKKDYYSSRRSHIVQHLNVDENSLGQKRKETTEKIISELFNDSANEVVIDGLFLTTTDVKKVLDIITQYTSDEFDLEIHYWTPDKEKCLHNDKWRRNVNSTVTIKNSTIEKPSDTELKEINDNYEVVKSIKLIEHEIITKPLWKMFSEENGIYIEEDRYLYSDSWSLGGNRRDCWGSDWYVSGDSQPDDFNRLDELLEKICPNITFLQYKNIKNQCVDVDEYSDHDYYGGCVEYARFRCDLEKLYDILQEKRLIESR